MEDLHHIAAIFTGIFTAMWDLLSWIVSTVWHSGMSPSIPSMIGIFLLTALWLGSGFAAATIAERRESSRFIHMILGLAIPMVYPLAIYLLMPRCKYDVAPAEAAVAKPAAKTIPERDEGPEEVQAPQEIPEPEEEQTDQIVPLPEEVRSQDSDTLKMSRSSIVSKAPKTPIAIAELDTTSTRTPIKGTPVVKQEAPKTPSTAPGFKAFDQRHFSSIATDGEGKFRGPFMIETTDGRFLEAIRIINALPDLIVLEMAAEGGKTRSVRLPYSKVRECKLKSDWLGQ